MNKVSTKIMKLSECKKCKQFKGRDKSMVKCDRHELVVCVICQPSNDNKGIKNGTMIVRCGSGWNII